MAWRGLWLSIIGVLTTGAMAAAGAVALDVEGDHAGRVIARDHDGRLVWIFATGQEHRPVIRAGPRVTFIVNDSLVLDAWGRLVARGEARDALERWSRFTADPSWDALVHRLPASSGEDYWPGRAGVRWRR